MKKNLNRKTKPLSLLMAAFLLTHHVSVAEMQADDGTVDILLWGASGCTGISHIMPKMAEEIGQKVSVRVLSRSFNAYPRAIRAAEAGKRAPEGVNPGTLPDGGAGHGYVNLEKDRSIQVHVLDEITSKKWDIIMFGLKTATVLDPKSYLDLDAVYEFSKKHNPQARFYLFQRPAPSNDDIKDMLKGEKLCRRTGALGSNEILTEDRWAELSSEYSLEWAEKNDVTPILVGDVVYWARRDAEWGFPDLPNHVEAKKYYDSLHGEKSRYPGDRRFRQGLKQNGKKYRVDHHPSVFGDYLIAATTYEVLFGQDARESKVVPARANQKEIAILRRIVHETVSDPEKYPLHQ